MSGKPSLVYNYGRGRAECIRLALVVGGEEFDEIHLTKREEYLQLCSDGQLLFNQLPLLIWNSEKLVQTNAIVRHIARKCGLYGKTPHDSTKVDMYFDGTRDVMSELMSIDFSPNPVAATTRFFEATVPKFPPIYDKILSDNGTGFLVGDSITIADTGLLEVLLDTEERSEDENVFSIYSGIKMFLETMKSHPKIQHYLQNIRKKRNTPEYVAMVKGIYTHLFS